MPEEITDQEREELKSENTVRKKKEMTAEEIMECPTRDCDGGPEITMDYRLPDGREVWMVWCPVCKGWISRYIAGDDPYGQGVRIWEEMRRGA